MNDSMIIEGVKYKSILDLYELEFKRILDDAVYIEDKHIKIYY